MNWFDLLKQTGYKGITFPVRAFSEEEIVEIWNESNPDNPRIARRESPNNLNPYTFEGDYLTAWDNNRMIGYSGWQDYGTYWVLAGTRVHPDYRRGGSKGFSGISRKLQNEKMNKMASKPGIGLINNTTLGGTAWADSFKRKFWMTNPDNLESYYDFIPKKVVDEHAEMAASKGQDFVIYLPVPMAKKWNKINASLRREK